MIVFSFTMLTWYDAVLQTQTTFRVDWTRLSTLSSITRLIFYQAGWSFWKVSAESLDDMYTQLLLLSTHHTIFLFFLLIHNQWYLLCFWWNQNIFCLSNLHILLLLPWCDVKERSSTWKSNGDSCCILKCQCHTIISPKWSNHASSSQNTHAHTHFSLPKSQTCIIHISRHAFEPHFCTHQIG